MTITLRPDLQERLELRLKSGAYLSADELVNAALEQFMSDEFEPGELNSLLAVGLQQARDGKSVAGEDVFRRLQERSNAGRRGE